MGENLFQKVKKSSVLRKTDFIAFLIAVIVSVAFILAVFLPKSKGTDGFYLSIENQTVIEYDFISEEFTVYPVDNASVEVNETGDKITFTVKSGKDLDKINIVLVDKEKDEVVILDANCPNGDCKTFSPISKTGKNAIIYCAHHDLMINAIKNSGYTPPVTGD